MTKLRPYFFLLFSLIGIYILLEMAGYKAAEMQRYRDNIISEFTEGVASLEEIQQSQDWQKHLVSYQKVCKSCTDEQLTQSIRETAASHDLQIIDLKKGESGYEVSLLADIDTDVYAFWHSISKQFSGAIHPVGFALFRPQSSEDKIQGRIQFSMVLPTGGKE